MSRRFVAGGTAEDEMVGAVDTQPLLGAGAGDGGRDVGLNLVVDQGVASSDDIEGHVKPSSSSSTTPTPSAGSGRPAAGVFPQVMNLSNTIVGAGLMALPKVVQELGIVAGSLSLVFVCITAVVTLGYIVDESAATGLSDFSRLVEKRLGRRWSHALVVSILVNNTGLLIVYLRIIGDVLVGSPKFDGIVTEFLHSGILTHRAFVIALIAAGVLFPLCSLERMDALAAASSTGLSLALTFGVVVIVIACISIHHDPAALWNGEVSWGPNVRFFSGNVLSDLGHALSIFPVIFTALVCHYNVLHVKEDLPPQNQARMPAIVRRAAVGCTGMYILVASFGYILFKDSVQDDVLLNFNCKSLAALVGHRGCVVVSVFVRAIYGITLTMTFPLIHFPLRQTEAAMFGRPETVGLTPRAMRLLW